MAPKKNPLKLNPLQSRTLAILQALSRVPDAAEEGPEPGEVTVNRFPRAHADHFHVGDAVVTGRDATGIFNEAVWNALARKGLAVSHWPDAITLTQSGRDYDTGLAEEILHHAEH